MSQTSEMIRVKFKQADDIRDAGLTTPDDIVRYDDIMYGTDPQWQMLDVYRPSADTGKVLPVIVNFHGGGWVYGDKERYQYYCMSLAQHGFAVVNFTYHLAPERKFPTPLEDANLVIHWIFEHAEDKRFAFDPNHIFGVGDSAGANLLVLYSAICTNPSYSKLFNFKTPEGFVPTAIVLNCGVYEIYGNEKDKEQTAKLMADYLENQGTPDEVYMISAIHHITEAFPSTFLMTCTGDFLAEQVVPMVQKFIDCKIPHEMHFYGDRIQDFGHVFHCNMKTESAKACNKKECTYFKKFL